MEDHPFASVYEKLAEATGETAPKTGEFVHIEASNDEMREIDELRRFALSVSQPPPVIYTMA